MEQTEIAEFFNLLVSDCCKAAALWDEFDDDFSKRSYVRTVFAFIEGNTYRLKQICLLIHSHKIYGLTEKQIHKVLEVKKDGKKVIVPTTENIELSFELYSEMFNVENPLDTRGQDWLNLKLALEVRHRLTHPKSVEDLMLSSEDMAIVGLACNYYREATCKLIGA